MFKPVPVSCVGSQRLLFLASPTSHSQATLAKPPPPPIRAGGWALLPLVAFRLQEAGLCLGWLKTTTGVLPPNQDLLITAFAARQLTACLRAGWPTAPSRQPMCHICPAGWATTQVDQSHCNMCVPGSYAASPQSPICRQCSNGSYTNSWGSTSCNHCIMGTYAPYRVCFSTHTFSYRP